jgi:hypothetical protein
MPWWGWLAFAIMTAAIVASTLIAASAYYKARIDAGPFRANDGHWLRVGLRSTSSTPPAHNLEGGGKEPRDTHCGGGKCRAEVGEPGEERGKADEKDLGGQAQDSGPEDA